MPLVFRGAEMILVIDNIDSFVYNLVQYVGVLGERAVVLRNTATLNDVGRAAERHKITHIIISPGPKTPRDAGLSNDVILEYGIRRELPTLGVCLGHQCIGYVLGGRIRNARALKHGKTSKIRHDGSTLFKGVPNPFEATRYHSLVVDDENLPEGLKVTARSEDDLEIMGLQHESLPIFGVQFHPESILTKHGLKIIRNFLDVS
ncbi:MAG: Anthranilate/para-aminobenzoate synthase component II [Candidatus Alkanophagales archaeon MCA70_species_2]|nr:Anthranilate/para-aminobenzoate synthase component II [Candidatus Alkanophaga liquidiphilum]